MVRVVVIGNGSIGKELCKQIEKQGWSVSSIFSSKEILDKNGKKIADISAWKSHMSRVDDKLVFLAIPTKDTGEKALEYITYFIRKGIPVVTREKGALAYHFKEVKPFLSKLGYNATVGGGTRMLSYFNSRNKKDISHVWGVFNGTLNYLFSELSKGKKVETVVQEISKKKYAEPGASSLEEIIQGELLDLERKAAIFANLSGFYKKVLTPKKVKLDTTLLQKALKDPASFRFLFSMDRKQVRVGLVNTEKMKLCFPDGVDNALYIQEGKNLYTLIGPGAGPEATAQAMIVDAKELL